MSPVKKADPVNLELSAFWVGLTHFVQQTGALGLLAVALIWGIPKILEERKDRQSIEEKMENYMKQDEGHMQRIEGFMGQVAEAVQRIGDGQRRGHDL